MKLAAAVFAVLILMSALPADAFAEDRGEGFRFSATNNVPTRLLPSLTDSDPPVIPAEPVKRIIIQNESPTHRFFDKTNALAFTALAGSLSADALSTQRGLALSNFHEMNPLARPFVQSRAGAAFYTASSFAFLSSGMYLAHRTNHHKMEKITPFIVAGWEGFLAARNYRLVSKVVNGR